MTKEELIARLKELGALLNREVSLTGSKEELALRVAELEEELGDGGEGLTEGDPGHLVSDGTVAGGEETKGQPTADTGRNTQPSAGELVLLETLVTLHIDALHATKNECVAIAEAGTVIRVPPDDAAAIIARGLARDV